MKSARNLYTNPMVLIATGIAASGLSIAVIAGGRNGLFGVALYYVIGAVCVIWLGWCLLKLVGAITSVTGLLRDDNPSRIKPGNNKIINELKEAVEKHRNKNSDYTAGLEKQVRDLQIQIQLAQRQKRNIEVIIYSIRDAVVVVDGFDKLLMANEAAGRLFGFDCKNSQRKLIGELICSEDADAGKSEFVEFLRQSMQSGGQATRREIKITANKQQTMHSKEPNDKHYAADAKERFFDCIVSCVYDEREPAAGDADKKSNEAKSGTEKRGEKKQVSSVVAVLHDITREKEVSQMKNDFVSHVSHELKTPLASISAYSEMLIDGEADNEQTRKEFYSIIQSQAKRLNRLIEDILNTSRIESGLIKVEKKPVSLTILIEEQMQMMKAYAEEKNISLSRGQTGQKPIVFDQVYVDKDMISQVIVNLLSNAVKYTKPGGSIKIETEVNEIESFARVSVTDTGVGISEDEIDHVFDKFYRVEANKNMAKGTGLGLNLVKQIVEKVHNGRVFVSSKPGVGSTFGFELPLSSQLVAQGS